MQNLNLLLFHHYSEKQLNIFLVCILKELKEVYHNFYLFYQELSRFRLFYLLLGKVFDLEIYLINQLFCYIQYKYLQASYLFLSNYS